MLSALIGIPHKVPFLFGSLSFWFSLQVLLKRVSELSVEFRIRQPCCFDAWGARTFGVVEFLWYKANLASHQCVVRIAIWAVVAVCAKYTL